MRGLGLIAGEVVKQDEPVWAPLLEAVGEDLIDGFMWMFAVELDDGLLVQAYKHRATRDYLHLDDVGGAYLYQSRSSYVEISLDRAIQIALANWPELGATEEDIAAVRAAVRRVRDRHSRPR